MGHLGQLEWLEVEHDKLHFKTLLDDMDQYHIGISVITVAQNFTLSHVFLNVLGFLVIPSIPNFFKSEFEYYSIILF